MDELLANLIVILVTGVILPLITAIRRLCNIIN